MAHKTQEHIYRNAKLKKEKKENEEKMHLTGYTAATQQISQPMSTWLLGFWSLNLRS